MSDERQEPTRPTSQGKYTLFADYFQFYIQDEDSKGDLTDAWTDQAVADLVALAPGVVGVGTVRNTDVPVEVEFLAQEPPLALDAWDHAVECDIALPSGKLVVAGCTDYFPDAARLSASPGHYRARLLYGGLGTLSEDGLRGDDHYRIELWQGPSTGLKVLKRDPSPNRRPQ